MNPIIDFITKPENYQLLVSIIGVVVSIFGVGVPLRMYLLKRMTIPKLKFDGIWKEPNCKGKNTCYYIKVKREKGEGNAEKVIGLVGIKDKKLKPSEWLKTKSEIAYITNYDYLLIFQTFDYNGKDIILFPEHIFGEFPQEFENKLFSQYKEKTLEVQIEADIARIKERHFQKKINDIINKSKLLPS